MRPLMTTKLQDVRVIWVGREPDPSPFAHPDGFAYSDSGPYVSDKKALPKQSRLMLDALAADPVSKDLLYPRHMSLRNWAKQGVLLWNVLPISKVNTAGYLVGHGFDELYKEIVSTVMAHNPDVLIVYHENLMPGWKDLPKGSNFLRMPGWSTYTDSGDKDVINFHVFSKINSYLKHKGQMPIDWSIK